MTSLIKKGFKTDKCKTLLKLTVSRIKLLRNKRNVLAKQSRDDVAQLLSKGQESNARVRVEHVFREENILATYDLIEQFCENLAGRLSIIESKKECPPELKEAIASLIYAAPRCADLQELQKIRDLFTWKYGKDFAATVLDLGYGCSVNTQIIEKLSSRAPSSQTTLKLLKEIASEHKIDWNFGKDISESKLPEESLDGPKSFTSASQALKTNVTIVPADSGRKMPDSTDANFPSGYKGKQQTAATHDTAATLPAAPFQNPPSSLSSPNYLNEAVLRKVKTPPPGKYGSLPVHTSVPTNMGGKQSEFDNGARSQVTSEMDIYAKAKAEGKMDYENLPNPWMHTSTDHDTLSSGVDPYTIAKAKGRMDYEVVSDSVQKIKRNQSTKQKEERVEKNQDTRFYQDAKTKAERHMHHNRHNSYLKEGNELSADGRLHETVLISQDMSEGKLIKATSPISKLTKSDSRSEYPDVATAAQVAFESAARAAEAAKAAIDMVGIASRRRSNRKLSDSDNLGKEGDLTSSSHLQKARQTNQWETEHSEDKAHKYEDGLIEDSLSPHRFVAYSSVHQIPVHPSSVSTETSKLKPNLHNTLDYLQVTQKRNSTETDFLAENSIEQVYLDEPTEWSQILKSDPRYVDTNMQFKTMDYGMTVSQVEDQLSVQDLSFEENSFGEVEPDELLNSSWKDQLEESAQSLKSDPGSANSKSVFDTCNHGSNYPEIDHQFSAQAVHIDREHESDKCFSFTWKHQSSNQIELHSMQYQSEAPRFDDCDSDDSINAEVPFYTKGRATICSQDGGLFASSLSGGKPKDTDAGEVFTPNKLQVDKKLEADFIKQEHCKFPQFDDYAEPVRLPVRKSFPVDSKSILRTENHTQGRFYDDDDVLAGSKGRDLSTSLVTSTKSYHECDKETHSILGWHPTSEKANFHLQSDESSPQADTLRSVQQSSYYADELSAHKQGGSLGNCRGEAADVLSHSKLRWHSSTSDEFDIHSESDEPSPLPEKFWSVKLSSHDENEEKADNEREGSLVTEENRREELAEANHILKGKSFFGVSRRSVRSTRLQLRQDPSPR